MRCEAMMMFSVENWFTPYTSKHVYVSLNLLSYRVTDIINIIIYESFISQLVKALQKLFSIPKWYTAKNKLDKKIMAYKK